MKTIINYIRSCFCKHEWKLLNKIEYYNEFHELPIGHKWIYICEKCMQKKVIKG